MNKQWMWGIGLCVLAALLLVGWNVRNPSAQSPVSERIAVKIGYREHDLYALAFVGVEQGIFSRHGLDVELVKFESTNQLTDALIANAIDASLGGVNVPLLYTIESKSPGELKLFTLAHETKESPVSFLLVKHDSPYQTLADLKGKTIGTFMGSTAKQLYKKTVSSSFSPDEATLTQMDPKLQLAALESGQVDAVIVLEPLATIGQETGIARVLDYGLFHHYWLPNMPLSASVVSQDFINQKPTASAALVAATDEAIQFITDHPTETKQILTKYTPIESTMIEKIQIVQFFPRTEMNVMKMQELADQLVKDGELTATIDVRTMLLPE